MPSMVVHPFSSGLYGVCVLHMCGAEMNTLFSCVDGAMQDLNALGPRLQLDLLRDWPKLALDRELWREVASRC